ncbi:MAG TPA: hypothetical protein VFW24_07395 [Acidimicrobiales bacterium]|nr:hypothetical protein [Acidimicrobiales bacterium]
MTRPDFGIVTRPASPGRTVGRVREGSVHPALARGGQGLAVVGAALILASATIHLHLWATSYRHIATVGPLFLAQGVVSIPLAVALIGLRRVALMLAGAALLVATAFGLLLSSWVALFGYQESLSAPYAGLSLVIEFGGAAVLLAGAGLTLAGSRAGR